MSLGLFAALQHSVRRMKADEARLRERMDDRIAAAGERAGGEADLPGEALACPRCATQYAFGGDCPDCGEALVSASFVSAGPAPPPPSRWHGVVVGAACVLAATVVVELFLRFLVG